MSDVSIIQKVSGLPIMVDLATAARQFSVSPRTIERWIKRGLPVYRGSNNGKRLLKPTDLEQFMTHQAAQVPDLGQMVDEIAGSLSIHTQDSSKQRPRLNLGRRPF